MIMTIYERQLEIERAKQFFKDRELAEELEYKMQKKSFTPAEEKAIGEAATDLRAMNAKLSKSTVAENYQRFKSRKEDKGSKNRHGRYTASGYGYEVKSFGPNTTECIVSRNRLLSNRMFEPLRNALNRS